MHCTHPYQFLPTSHDIEAPYIRNYHYLGPGVVGQLVHTKEKVSKQTGEIQYYRLLHDIT